MGRIFRHLRATACFQAVTIDLTGRGRNPSLAGECHLRRVSERFPVSAFRRNCASLATIQSWPGSGWSNRARLRVSVLGSRRWSLVAHGHEGLNLALRRSFNDLTFFSHWCCVHVSRRSSAVLVLQSTIGTTKIWRAPLLLPTTLTSAVVSLRR